MNHPTSPLSVPLLLLFLLLSVGCSGRMDKPQELDRCLHMYHHAVQFGDFNDAGRLVVADQRETFYVEIEKHQKRFSIANFYIRSVTMNEDQTEATVVIIREVVDNDSQESRSETVVQKWKRVGQGAWMLMEGTY